MVGEAALVLLAAVAAPAEREALVAMDVKDAAVASVATALGEAGGYQVVLDPGLTCRLTLKLQAVPYAQAFEAALRACGLGFEGGGRVLRVARTETLRREAAERRRFEETKGAPRPRQATLLRLSHARASEMATLLERLLGPGAKVAFDERTNTLILIQ